MSQLANEIVGAQVAKAVAQRAEALEVLRKAVKPMGIGQYVAAAMSAGIGGAIAGHSGVGGNSELLGVAVGCALSLGASAAVECYQMRKRLESAITVLLQEVKDGA